jgi:two-component system, NarL family, response regulator
VEVVVFTQDPIRVLICDDHPIVRAGVAGIINADAGFVVVGEASNGDDAIREYFATGPDVTLMDLRMPGVDGVTAIRTIRARDHHAKVVILTTFDGEEEIYRGMRAGALAYLLKDAPPDEILACVRGAARGERYLSGFVAARLAERLSKPELSKRELSVLTLVASGRSNREIAVATGITEGTVKFHMTAILAKLGVSSRTEAVSVAARYGLITL